MANVQIVETSLRDGNQSLWAALGVDTAKTLTIAPVLDRVGFLERLAHRLGDNSLRCPLLGLVECGRGRRPPAPQIHSNRRRQGRPA